MLYNSLWKCDGGVVDAGASVGEFFKHLYGWLLSAESAEMELERAAGCQLQILHQIPESCSKNIC